MADARLREKIRELAKRTQVTIDEENLCATSPLGFVFKATDTHYLFASNWRELLAGLRRGLRPCRNPVCRSIYRERKKKRK